MIVFYNRFLSPLTQETVASESLPLLGFTVKLSDKQDGEEAASVFQLYHKNTLYYTFKAEDNHTAQRWDMNTFWRTSPLWKGAGRFTVSDQCMTGTADQPMSSPVIR